MTTKQKILDEIEACYAQGEWGGERPEQTFKTLKRLFIKYLAEKKG